MSESLGWRIESEMLLDDAQGLARAGELAARALDEESDRDAFSSQFWALYDKVSALKACKEAARAKLKELRASLRSKGAADV